MSGSQFSMPNGTEKVEKSLRNLFFRWLMAAIAVTAFVTAFNVLRTNTAYGADVFIDEGEGDFDKPTPVETPADNLVSSGAAGGTETGVGLDFDADMDAAKAGTADAVAPLAATATENIGAAESAVSQKVESTMPESQVAPIEPAESTVPVAKAANKVAPPKAKAVKSAKKATAKKDKKSAKMKASKSTKTADKASKNKSKKSSVALKSSKKKPVAKSAKKSRKIANIKYAGGQYVKTSKDCPMESAPGAADTIGQTKANRKLWVEDAGDANYWKVYSKSGAAAYLSRSCF